jgi:hypothetical protein
MLRDALLGGAKLQGASFQSAQMQNISLESAEMQGASLTGARMLGASLDNAKLHGAIFYGTLLQGASFRRTQLHGAVFRDARLEGAAFDEAQLQGVQFERMQLRYAVLSNSFLWDAGRVQCDGTHVAEPNWESVVDVRYARDKPVLVPANAQEIANFIARSLEEVPESSSAVPEFSKSKLRDDLNMRLRAAASDGPTPGEAAWRKCAEDSQARTEKGFGELTATLLRYLCSPFDRAHIAPGMVRAWNTAKLSETLVAKTLAQSLLEEDEHCPGAKTLDEKARKNLQNVINAE